MPEGSLTRHGSPGAKPPFAGRVPEATTAAAIGILLIVFGHAFISQDFARNNPEWYRAAQRCVYQFHIKLFFVLAGYLLVHSRRDRATAWPHYVGARLQKLLVPYLLFTAINLPLAALLPVMARQAPLSLHTAVHMLLYPLDNVIRYHWFLVALSGVTLFSPLFLWASRSPRRSIAFTPLLLALFVLIPKRSCLLLMLSALPHYALYFWVGCVVSAHGQRSLLPWIRRHPHIAGAVALALAAMLYAAWIAKALPGRAGGILLREAFALTAIATVWCAATAYHACGWRWLERLEGRNFTIFLLSWYGHKLTEWVLYRSLGVPFAWVFPISFATGIALPLAAAALLRDRHPLLNLALGLPPPPTAGQRHSP